MLLCSCSPKINVPQLATRPYPYALHNTNVVDIQCFRRGTDLEIVNATAQSFEKFSLWINQRYVHEVPSMPAGATVRVSLWDFVDQYGRRFYAGGFFRSYPAEPVRLAEIQTAEDKPLIGLIAIRTEPVTTIKRE